MRAALWVIVPAGWVAKCEPLMNSAYMGSAYYSELPANCEPSNNCGSWTTCGPTGTNILLGSLAANCEAANGAIVCKNVLNWVLLEVWAQNLASSVWGGGATSNLCSGIDCESGVGWGTSRHRYFHGNQWISMDITVRQWLSMHISAVSIYQYPWISMDMH